MNVTTFDTQGPSSRRYHTTTIGELGATHLGKHVRLTVGGNLVTGTLESAGHYAHATYVGIDLAPNVKFSKALPAATVIEVEVADPPPPYLVNVQENRTQ